MRNKNTFFLILVLLISACAGSKRPVADSGQSASKSVETLLLENFPARSALESQVLTERLLALDETGIAEICRFLQVGGELQTKAEFALNLLADAMTRPQHASARNMFVRTLGKVLQGDLTPENKAFLIAQLQIASNDAAVPVLAGFLDNPRLEDPALTALAAIGTTKALGALTKAYSEAERTHKSAILQAISFSQSPGATQFLQREANSDDAEIAELATSLLASNASHASSAKIAGPENLSDKIPLTPSAEALLKSPDAAMRLAAIEDLMLSGDSVVVDILLAHLQNVSDEDEIFVIEKALMHLPVRERFAALAGAIPKLQSPAARAAILRVLTARRAETEAVVFLELADSDPDVRTTALKGLQAIGNPAMLPELLSHTLQAETPAEKTAAIQAFAAIARNENVTDHAIDLVQMQFDKADSTQKILLLPLFGKLAGPKSLATVVTATESDEPALCDVAIRELAEWPEPAALPRLLEIAEQSENLAHHVLALRGCARLMSTDSLATTEKIQIFDDGMAVALRMEEKKMLLAGLQSVRSPEALKRALDFVDDADLGFEAAVAALKIAEIEGERHTKSLQREMVLVLLEDRLVPEVKSQVRDYLDAQVEQNRPPEGFTALFNGVDLTGWKGLVKDPPARAKMLPEELAREQVVADSIMSSHWSVESGVLKFDGTQFYNLCTARDYGDFEFLLDWKIAKGGDSGIYLRGSPQVQIWDPNLPNASVGSGGLYNNQQHPNVPLIRADKPVGEWNTFRILMIDEKVTVFLNDVLVVDEIVLENYWQRELPIYPNGQIELQAHNSPLRFRNIFIREIPRQQPAFDGDLFNGKDLTGWQIIEGQEGSWGVKDGILFTAGKGGGWLSTTREFDNFKLELKFRVSEGGNSGVFLRAPHQGDPAYTGMEIQVLDDYAEKYATLKPWQYTGSIYAVQPPSERASKKAGEWQSLQIVCNGPSVQVTLNSVKIVDANLIAHGDKEHRNPGLKRREGFIGLQNHGSLVEYRNIRLMELR